MNERIGMNGTRVLWRIGWLLGLLAALALLAGCLPGELPTAPSPTRTAGVPLPIATFTPIPTTPEALSLYVLPEDGLAPLLEAIGETQDSLDLMVYLLSEPQVIQALKDAAQRGVRTRVMLEEQPLGASGVDEVAGELEAAGVQVGWGQPAWRMTHAKGLLSDGRRLFLMTHNLTKSSFRKNREFGIISEEPADCIEFAQVFEADWSRTGIDLPAARLVWSPENARERLLALLNGAQREVLLEEQSLQDDEVILALQKALQRGVAVRLISSVHAPLAEDADEPGRQAIREAGAQVRYLTHLYVHAKVIVVDGRQAFVGSQNLTTSGLDFNREAGRLFEAPALIERMIQVFEADWQVARTQPDGGPADEDAAPVIEPTQAGAYMGQRVTVQMTVTDEYHSDKVTWLMPDADRDHNFKAVIFSSDWAKWPAAPHILYLGRTLRVIGTVEEYRGWAEIVVDAPEQIEALE